MNIGAVQEDGTTDGSETRATHTQIDAGGCRG
jgi:hypothetical protein